MSRTSTHAISKIALRYNMVFDADFIVHWQGRTTLSFVPLILERPTDHYLSAYKLVTGRRTRMTSSVNIKSMKSTEQKNLRKHYLATCLHHQKCKSTPTLNNLGILFVLHVSLFVVYDIFQWR